MKKNKKIIVTNLILGASTILPISYLLVSCNDTKQQKNDDKSENNKNDENKNQGENNKKDENLNNPNFEYNKIDDQNIHLKNDSRETLYLKGNKNAIRYINLLKPDDFLVWKDKLTEYSDEDKKTITNFVENLDGIKEAKSTKAKAKIIYDWVVTNIKYATNTQPFLKPIDVFINKVAICHGYSNLYKAMLNSIGIPSAIVIGFTKKGAHAWNLVYDGNEWFFSDSTWGVVDINNFDKSVEQFSKDHYSTQLLNARFNEENYEFDFHYGLSIKNIDKPNKKVIIPTNFKGFNISSFDYEFILNNNSIEELVVSNNIWMIIGTANVVNAQGDEFQVRNAESSINFKSFLIDKNNDFYESKNGVLYTKGLKEILCYPKNKQDSKFILPKETIWFDEKETFINNYLKEISVDKENAKFYSKNNSIFSKKDNTLLFKIK
ncbi:hypothetical protein DMC14_002605 [Metamycoplasma phocicerebrale]|uniref:Transglutaminase-like domain-containing protein n=1 Tax=Metamycoplasma phocicerebrale TaxID=142649 RepID=A0A3Q9V9G1_9BACT|nr:transglutaminase domain-containing protein [Metamycoplasma phocicerebrale]AZZ65661.1 hypothetical protein DMC14_002605 [Metamycoplasma phocicerebrale]